MAAAAFTPPKFEPAPSDNICAQWRTYKSDFDIYLLASNLRTASGERKVAILLYGLGSRYKPVFDSFHFANDAGNIPTSYD